MSSRENAGKKNPSRNKDRKTISFCAGKLSNGESCTKEVSRRRKYCRWHDPEDKSWYGLYSFINTSAPDQQTDIILWMIEDHPEKRLELPEREGYAVDLSNIDLSRRNFEKKHPQEKMTGKVRAIAYTYEDPSFNFGPPSLRKANLEGVNLRNANLKGQSLSDANLKKTFLTDANLQDANLKESNLQGAYLESANLRRADLSFANLQGAYFDENTNFKDAVLYKTNLTKIHADLVRLPNFDLKHADFEGALLNGAIFQGAKLSYANFKDASLRGANFIDAQLFNANLNGANLERAKLHRADLPLVHFEGAEGEKAIFREANLAETTFDENSYFTSAHFEGAILKKAILRGAHFDSAHFNSAHLEYSDSSNVDFDGAKLIGCNFFCANLQGANLEGSDLKGSNLRNAKLQGVDLTEVEDISDSLFSGIWLEKTRVLKKQLGESIQEEKLGEYTSAKRSYLALKQNFESLGDYSAASWAYCKEKDMLMYEAWKIKKYPTAFATWFVKWLCKYGEGVEYVFFWIVAFLFIIAPTLFHLLSYQFIWSHEKAHEYEKLSYLAGRWFIYKVDILYTLDTLTTATFSSLKPNSFWTTFASGLVAIIGVVLFGLLGFVIGNRIRRS